MASGESSRMVSCSNCGAQLPKEWASKGDKERPPCPNCGSMKINRSHQLWASVQFDATTATSHESNEKALARWALNRPAQDVLAVAVRAALRCLWFPICEAKQPERLALMGFRLCAWGVLTATSKNAPSVRTSLALIGPTTDRPWYRTESALLWRRLALILMSVDDETPQFIGDVVTLARQAADIISNPADADDSWAEVDTDVEAMSSRPGDAVLKTDLFSPSVSKYILQEVKHSNDRYRERGLGFLADWYESMIAGRVDTELLREIVGIREHDWAKGADRVRELLATFEVGRRLRDATPLAEEVVFDERSDKLRVEPIRVLPPDLYETGLEKLRDAVDDARAANERNPNSYTALQPTLAILDRTLTNYRGNPQRVHDDQLLAIRNIERLVDDGYVPDDQETASLAQVLDTNAVDIRAAIPAVAVAVKKRSEVRIRELESADRDRIRAAVKAVAADSDEALAEEMREDDRATFESEGPEPDIESPYRLVSRLGAVARALRSLEEIAGFVERHAPLIARVGNNLLPALGRLVGL